MKSMCLVKLRFSKQIRKIWQIHTVDLFRKDLVHFCKRFRTFLTKLTFQTTVKKTCQVFRKILYSVSESFSNTWKSLSNKNLAYSIDSNIKVNLPFKGYLLLPFLPQNKWDSPGLDFSWYCLIFPYFSFKIGDSSCIFIIRNQFWHWNYKLSNLIAALSNFITTHFYH